jgi:hypothetical protein
VGAVVRAIRRSGRLTVRQKSVAADLKYPAAH